MNPRRRILLALVLCSVVALPLAGIVDARPPPKAMCGACGTTVVEEATADGTTPAVVRSEVTIRIDRNGSGHWTARTAVTDGESIDWNRSRLRANAVQSLESDSTAPENVRDVRVAVENGTVIVRFVVPDVARRATGDVVLVDYFYWDGDSARWFALDADRVAIRGPPGSTATYTPDGTTREDGTVVWTRDGDESYDSYPISQGTFVAFADDGGITKQAAAHVAVAGTVADAKFSDLPGTAFLPMVVLGIYAALLVRRAEAFVGRTRIQRAAVAGGLTAGLALASILVTFLLGNVNRSGGVSEQFRAAVSTALFPALGVLPVFIPMVGFLGVQYLFGRFVAPSLGERWYDRSFIWQGLGIVALGVLSIPFVVASSGTVATVAAGLAAATAVLLFMPLGVAYRRSAPSRYLLVAGIVGAPLVLALGFGPYGNFDRLYFPVYFVPWSLAVGALGVLAFVMGVRFADAGPVSESENGDAEEGPAE
ncbi:MAG: hypothetical protein ACOCUO_01255 [archaeon]